MGLSPGEETDHEAMTALCVRKEVENPVNVGTEVRDIEGNSYLNSDSYNTGCTNCLIHDVTELVCVCHSPSPPLPPPHPILTYIISYSPYYTHGW